MTYAMREAIFSKDYITIQDMQLLLGLEYDEAAKKIRDIKKALILDPKYNGQGVRLDMRGKLHVQDYFDYFKITDYERYSQPSVIIYKTEGE